MNDHLRDLLNAYRQRSEYGFSGAAPLTVHSRNNDLETPLFIACRHGSIEDVRALLRAGSDVDATDVVGTTALHVAVMICAWSNSTTEVVEELIKAGASVDAKTMLGAATPADLAKSPNRGAILLALGQMETPEQLAGGGV